jgi:Hypervirulence associated proteins TUDOR domain
MSQEFKQGDRVTWKSHGGIAEGEVLRKSWRAGR